MTRIGQGNFSYVMSAVQGAGKYRIDQHNVDVHEKQHAQIDESHYVPIR